MSVIQLLKPSEAAKLLSITVDTLRRWTAAGIVPYVRIGATTRYADCSLLEWLASNEKVPGEGDHA